MFFIYFTKSVFNVQYKCLNITAFLLSSFELDLTLSVIQKKNRIYNGRHIIYLLQWHNLTNYFIICVH